MEQKMGIQGKLIREFYDRQPQAEMPAELRERIVASVRTAREERYSLRNERKGVWAAVIISMALIAAIVGMAVYFGLPSWMTGAFEGTKFRFELPRISFDGAGMWFAIGSAGLILLVVETLLTRRFMSKELQGQTKK